MLLILKTFRSAYLSEKCSFILSKQIYIKTVTNFVPRKLVAKQVTTNQRIAKEYYTECGSNWKPTRCFPYLLFGLMVKWAFVFNRYSLFLTSLFLFFESRFESIGRISYYYIFYQKKKLLLYLYYYFDQTSQIL